MRAIIEVSNETLKQLEEQGILVLCSEKDAVILPAYTDGYILEEIDYINEEMEGKYSEALRTNEKVRNELLKEVHADLKSFVKNYANPTDEDLHDMIERHIEGKAKEYESKKSAAR